MSPRPGGARPRATVAIVNYKGREYLDELLPSLQRQSYHDFETLLIDNDSRDGSLEHVAEGYPWVRLLPQKRNIGFAPAGNLAAREGRGRYLALLNTDLRLDADWLAELVCAAEEHSAAAVASKMLLHDRPDHLNGVGGAMNRVGYTWDRGMYEEDRGQYDRSEEVLFASAGAALFRRDVFIEAGGFDERFFMYHEDVDLCWRLWILGHRVVTAPKAVAYHHFGGTTAKTRGMSWRELLGERNSMRSMLKNYEWRNAMGAIREMMSLRYEPKRKWGQVRNLLWNLWALPGTLLRRRRIQKRRRRSDRDLKHLIVQSRDVPVRL